MLFSQCCTQTILEMSWYDLSSFFFHLQLHPTLSACPLTPLHQLWSIPTQLHYVHCQTSPGLMSDLLRSNSHAKGYHLDTLYNLSDLSSLVIMGNCLSSWLTPFSALPIHYIYLDSSRMRRQLSSHFYSGKVPLMYILQSVHYNISTQSFSRDVFPLSDPS